jgi:hypothetical protein
MVRSRRSSEPQEPSETSPLLSNSGTVGRSDVLESGQSAAGVLTSTYEAASNVTNSNGTVPHGNGAIVEDNDPHGSEVNTKECRM